MKSKVDEYRELFDPFITATVPTDHGDYETFCPAHENPGTSKKPSATINFTPRNKSYYPNGMLSCHVCDFSGKDCNLDNIASIYNSRVASGVKFGRAERVERQSFFQTGKKYKLPSILTRREFTLALLEDPVKLAFLKDRRGLNLESVKEWRLGWVATRGAYCYPATKAGKVYAMRLYRPDDPSRKYSWYNSEEARIPELLGIEGMESKAEVVITEGEFDMMLARQDGVNAVTHTAGAGKWHNDWNPWFKDKVVYIAYDADSAGRKGRAKVVQALRNVARAIYFIDFPNPVDKSGTDYTDYRMRDYHSAEDFKALMFGARTKGPETENKTWDGLPTSGKRVSLTEAMSSKYSNKDIELDVQVLSQVDKFEVPSQIDLDCTMDKGEKICASCPMGGIGHKSLTIEKKGKFVSRVIGSRESEVTRFILEEAGTNCKDRVTFEVMESWTVEEIIVAPSIDSSDDNPESHLLSSASSTTERILSIDTFNTKANEVYRAVGQPMPDPKNQRKFILAWHTEPSSTNIEQFRMTEEIRKDLEVFQPQGSQGVYRKLWNIAHDLSTNVAGIIQREELVMAYDIAWHSALAFNFLGKLEEKGWVELLVFGDTRTGKSEAAQSIAAWYKNGKVFSSEGATRAGLVGAATQPAGTKHWVPSWGAIPQNDRRLLVLDEAQSLQDIVKDMGSIRSKGKAEMVKAGINASANARTRLVWICNPVSQGKLDEMTDGALTALAEFMPASEDRARFDLAIAVSSSDVDTSAIYKGIQKDAKTPAYSSENCRNLVLWSWSRDPGQIVISKSVESHIIKRTAEIVKKYEPGGSELVQGSNMQHKVARIAVAIAARVFSTDETGELLIVKDSHVDAAQRIIFESYDNDILGLGRSSRRATKQSVQATGELGKLQKWFVGGKDHSLPATGIETYRALRRLRGRFRMEEFGLIAGLDQIMAKDTISNLIGLNVVTMEGVSGNIRLGRELLGLVDAMEEEFDD